MLELELRLFPLQGLTGHLDEDFFNVVSLGGARLVKWHILVLSGPLLTIRSGHGPILCLVQLVAETDQRELFCVAATIIQEALLPAVKVLERDRLRDIVNEAAAVSAAVEGVS